MFAQVTAKNFEDVFFLRHSVVHSSLIKITKNTRSEQRMDSRYKLKTHRLSCEKLATTVKDISHLVAVAS